MGRSSWGASSVLKCLGQGLGEAADEEVVAAAMEAEVEEEEVMEAAAVVEEATVVVAAAEAVVSTKITKDKLATLRLPPAHKHLCKLRVFQN